MGKISVIVEESNETRTGTLGILDRERIKTAVKEVDAEKIQKSLRELVEQLSGIMKEDKIKLGSLHLSELEVNVEITAEGGVALVGVAKAGIKGAITLKFSR
jgi:hypothetical protein